MSDNHGIRLLAVDMDDTLVERDGLPGAEAVDAIREAVSLGVRVTIATGRMHVSALPSAKALGLDVPLITYNGALIRESLSGETLSHTPVRKSVTREVIRYCGAAGLSLNIYIDDTLKVAAYNEYVRYYEELVGVRAGIVGPLGAYFDGVSEGRPEEWGSTKLLVITDPERAQAVMGDISARFGGELAITGSNPRFIEMMNPGVSKAAALGYLAGRWGVGRDSIMAVGDSLNDLEMVEYAGMGVSVANGSAALKASADYVTSLPGSRGVAEAIRRFVLQ